MSMSISLLRSMLTKKKGVHCGEDEVASVIYLPELF